MTGKAPPAIFSPHRRRLARQRALRLQQGADAGRYVLDDMVEDVLERLSFLRHQPARAMVLGDWSGALGQALIAQGCAVTQADPATGFAEEQPWAEGGHDLIVSLGLLDTLNDPVGALIHMRAALAPGGLALASFVGAGSLQGLRDAMLAADGDRPAPRLHPAIDVRSGGQLLQRAGWERPVVDSRNLEVRFSSLTSLLADLRAQALGNVLSRPGPALGKAALARAVEAFGVRRVERIEIVTLSGWRS